jgi:hypothetical protein
VAGQREIISDSDMDIDHQIILDNDINKTCKGLNGIQNTEIPVPERPTVEASRISSPIANAVSTLTTTISKMASAIYTVPTTFTAINDDLLPVLPDQSVIAVAIPKNLQSVDSISNDSLMNCDDLTAVPVVVEAPHADYNGNTNHINEEINSIRINTLPTIGISNNDSNVSTSSSHGSTYSTNGSITSRIEAIKTADLLMTSQLSRLLKDDIHVDLVNVLTGVNNNDSSEGDVRTSTCSYPDMSDTDVMPFCMHLSIDFVLLFFFVFNQF